MDSLVLYSEVGAGRNKLGRYYKGVAIQSVAQCSYLHAVSANFDGMRIIKQGRL